MRLPGNLDLFIEVDQLWICPADYEIILYRHEVRRSKKYTEFSMSKSLHTSLCYERRVARWRGGEPVKTQRKIGVKLPPQAFSNIESKQNYI